MAILKQVLHKKTSSGTYDTVYLRTRTDNVLMTDNSTLLSDKLTSMDTAIDARSHIEHDHANLPVNPNAVEIYPGVNGIPYIDFHFGIAFSESATDYTSRIIESSRCHLNVELSETKVTPTTQPLYSGHNLIALYSKTVTFTNGTATFTHAAITTNSVCFVQRRSGSVGKQMEFCTHSNNGSLTICGPSSLNESFSVNILIINTEAS